MFEGYIERDIAAKLRCSKTAVHSAIVIFNADGTFYDRKRSGRPRKTALNGRPLNGTDSIAIAKEFLQENPC